MASIALNARFFSHKPTGMQRYGIEMANRLSDVLDVVRPSVPMKGAKGHLWEQMYLPTATRHRLLWSPNNTGPLAVARQLCTIHDIIPVDHPEWFNARFAQWYEWLLPKLVNRVEHMIAVSQFTKDRVVERFGVRPEKISVVWNGVDATFYPRSTAEIAAMRQSAGLPEGRYVLSLGSLEPRKNLARLLVAWRKLAEEIDPDIQLVVAGAKGASQVFAQADLGPIPARVHFAGYIPQEQLPMLYSGAMALVYPSLYEGFGLPPLEAMACGCPVVTSSTTSLPEVAGTASILVDPRDTDAIANGMWKLLSSKTLRHDLSRRGQHHARSLTWDRSAAATRKILLAHA